MWRRLRRGGWRGRWSWRRGLPYLAWVFGMLLPLSNQSQQRRSWGEREADHSRHAMGPTSPLFLLLLLGTRREGTPSTTDQIGRRKIDWIITGSIRTNHQVLGTLQIDNTAPAYNTGRGGTSTTAVYEVSPNSIRVSFWQGIYNLGWAQVVYVRVSFGSDPSWGLRFTYLQLASGLGWPNPQCYPPELHPWTLVELLGGALTHMLQDESLSTWMGLGLIWPW